MAAVTVTTWLAWVLGAAGGIALGGVWASDRAYMAALTPREVYGEFYGLYGTVGRFATITGPLLCLDGVGNPHNLGSILRTAAHFGAGAVLGRKGDLPPLSAAVARVADAAGFAGLVIPSRGSPGITPVACKASAGAVEHLPIARIGSVVAFVNDLAGAGRWSVGADADAGTDYREVAWDPSAVIVLGAEGAGLRPKVREVCDQLVRIPMRGRVGSLNLSTAAAVLAFRAVAGG